MKPILAGEYPDGQRPVLLNAIQHQINDTMADITTLVGEVQAVAVTAIEGDRAKLERKIELINRVADKALGLAQAAPVPLPEIAVTAFDAAAQKIKDKVIGDMRGEMTSAMDAAIVGMDQARIDLLWELNAKRSVIAVQTVDLLTKRSEILENAALPEIERYEKLRQIEKGFSTLESYAITVNAQMDSLKRALVKAKTTAELIATQGAETGHQEATKRMPEQESITQSMYQRAVLKYMETRFTDTRSAPLLKSEEIKMLEQAFPERFVMDRTLAGEAAKQRAELGREITQIRVAARMQIESMLDKDAIRDKVARDEAASLLFPKTGAALRNAQEKAIQDEIDRLMKQQCNEHVILKDAMVPSSLASSTKVCQSTENRHRKLAAAIDPDAAVSGTTVTIAEDAVVKISSFRAGAHTKDCINEVLKQERNILERSSFNDRYLKDADCQLIMTAAQAKAAERGGVADEDIKKAQFFREALSEIIALPNGTDAEKTSRVEQIVAFEQDFERAFQVSAASELSHFESFTALQSEKIAHASHMAEVEAQHDELEATKASIGEKITVLKDQLLERRDSVQFNPATTTEISLEIEALDSRLKSLSGTYAVQKTALSAINASVGQCSSLLATMSKTDAIHFDRTDSLKFPSVVQVVLETDTTAMTLDQKVAHDHFAAAVIAQYRLDPHLVQEDITSLRSNVATQTTVLKDYQAMHEIERTTPASVRADIEKFRVALEDEITRMSAKGSDAVTTRKVSLLRAEVNNLDLLKGMVDTHVSFASIQRRLTEVVTHVMDAAKIQRGFIHTSSTSATKNLSKFEVLKDVLAQRRAEVESGAHARIASHDAHAKAPDVDEGVRQSPRVH